MSIEVPVHELGERLEQYPWCFVVTVDAAATADDASAGGPPDWRAHLLACAPQWVGGRYRIAVGGSTRRNVTANPAVTLAFPPGSGSEFSLLVDAVAEVDGDDIVAVPQRAVLHRPAIRD